MKDKINEFKQKKEVMKARHTAAEADVNISETLNGVGEGENIQGAMDEMDDEIEELEARAEAMDEYEKEESVEDDIDARLDNLSSTGVNDELEQLKSEFEEETEEVESAAN